MEPLTIPDLYARRSIRRYTGEPPSEEQLTTLLEAAMAAPSAGNRKPWHFIVVTEPALLERLAAAHPHAKMLPQAGACLVPCGEPARCAPGRPEFWVQDVSAATENILLTATALGLGAVWCGVFPIEEIVAAVQIALGLPQGVLPLCLVAVGHPAETQPPRTQYDAARVHRNGWE